MFNQKRWQKNDIRWSSFALKKTKDIFFESKRNQQGGEMSIKVELNMDVFGWTYISSCFAFDRSEKKNVVRFRCVKSARGEMSNKVELDIVVFGWTYISSFFTHFLSRFCVESNVSNFTCEECPIHHRRRLSVRRRSSHRWLFERDQCPNSIGMDVFLPSTASFSNSPPVTSVVPL